VTRDSMCGLRVPSIEASASSSKQGMSLAVEHTIALLDGGLADGLCQMAFPAAGWADKQPPQQAAG
jgi:hypothetical protein